MRGIVFNIACVLSTVLLAATIVMHVVARWSDSRSDRVSIIGYAYAGLRADPHGRIWISNEQTPYHGSIIGLDGSNVPRTIGFGDFAGIYYRRHTWPTHTWWTLIVSLWYPTALFSLLPVIWMIRRIRRRRPPGYCQRCGYDLTGNDTGRCPECGCATKSLEKEDCEGGPYTTRSKPSNRT